MERGSKDINDQGDRDWQQTIFSLEERVSAGLWVRAAEAEREATLRHAKVESSAAQPELERQLASRAERPRGEAKLAS